MPLSRVRTPGRPSRPETVDRSPGALDAGFLIAAVVWFCLGYVLAVSAPGASYSWYHDMVSDLGRGSCRTWYGSWVCSPRSRWFDACIAAAGFCLLLATIRLRVIWGVSLSVAMAALGAGLVWLAVFPSDGLLPLHMVGAVLALPLTAAAITVSGMRPQTEWTLRDRMLRTVFGIASLVLCLDHVAPAPAPVPRGAAESGTIVLLLALLVVEATRCLCAASRRR